MYRGDSSVENTLHLRMKVMINAVMALIACIGERRGTLAPRAKVYKVGSDCGPETIRPAVKPSFKTNRLWAHHLRHNRQEHIRTSPYLSIKQEHATRTGDHRRPIRRDLSYQTAKGPFQGSDRGHFISCHTFYHTRAPRRTPDLEQLGRCRNRRFYHRRVAVGTVQKQTILLQTCCSWDGAETDDSTTDVSQLGRCSNRRFYLNHNK
jgi:hypothetical protein